MTPLEVEWTAPPNVRALQTIRKGGVSQGAYAGNNLALHVGDDPLAVQTNRRRLVDFGVPSEPLWLEQVHSNYVHDFDASRAPLPRADGAVTTRQGVVLAILTADCLPLLAFSRTTGRVGAFHGGWKGLAYGIIENGLSAMGGSPIDQDWWIGPGIGPATYTVGNDVRRAFLADDPEHGKDFVLLDEEKNRWRFDLASAARRRLQREGVFRITTAPWTTDDDTDLFWSYRLKSPCGRTATLIWKVS